MTCLDDAPLLTLIFFTVELDTDDTIDDSDIIGHLPLYGSYSLVALAALEVVWPDFY